ncbi:hypothetical protein LTR36_007065, partial [Oleoguttula mirabilis]
MSHLLHALSHAERHTISTSARCVGAREDAVAAQNSSFATYRALREFRDQIKRTAPDVIQDFDACESEATEASREASVMLLFLEKQLENARKEEAEARL